MPTPCFIPAHLLDPNGEPLFHHIRSLGDCLFARHFIHLGFSDIIGGWIPTTPSQSSQDKSLPSVWHVMHCRRHGSLRSCTSWICIVRIMSLVASWLKPEREQSNAASLPSTLLTLLCWTVEMIHQSCEVLGSLCWKGWLGRAREHQKSSWVGRKVRGPWHCSARAPCCRGWWRKSHSGSAGPCCSGAPGLCTAARGKEMHRNVTEATLAQAG